MAAGEEIPNFPPVYEDSLELGEALSLHNGGDDAPPEITVWMRKHCRDLPKDVQ